MQRSSHSKQSLPLPAIGFLYFVFTMISAEAATYNPPRSVGPLTLGMSISEFLEATGQTIVECSTTPDENFNFLAESGTFNACGLTERYNAIRQGNAISTQTSVGNRSVTVILGARKNTNERMKKLTDSEFEPIENFFVDGKLAWVRIPLPTVTLEFLEEKYGSSSISDQTETIQCFNEYGFSDSSNFGVISNFWHGPTETLAIERKKLYDNDSKSCSGSVFDEPNKIKYYQLIDNQLAETYVQIIESVKTDEQPTGASEF